MIFLNKNSWLRRISVASIILIFIATNFINFILIPPKPAQAIGIPVMEALDLAFDAVTTAMDAAMKIYDDTVAPALKTAWNKLRGTLLNSIVGEMLKWVQDTAAFVDDWGSYIGDLVGQDVLSTLNDILTYTMCPATDAQLSFDLQFTFAPPKIDFSCPVDAQPYDYDNFSWDRWNNSLLTQGDKYGRYYTASDSIKTEAILTRQEELAKLGANSGARGTKGSDGLSFTPGILQVYAAQRGSMMDLDYLLNSDDPMEFFGSIATSYIHRMIQDGFKDMITDPTSITYGPPPDYSWNSLPPETQEVIQIKKDYDYISQIVNNIPLTQENLKSLVSEQQINLQTVSQILDTQTQIISDINDLKYATSTPPCSMPDWAATYPTTPVIQNQYNQLSQAIAQNQESINSIPELIESVKSLAGLMQKVIQASDFGNASALTQALTDYNAAKTPIWNALKSIAGVVSDKTSGQEILDGMTYGPVTQTNELINARPELANQLAQENAYLTEIETYVQMCPTL